MDHAHNRVSRDGVFYGACDPGYRGRQSGRLPAIDIPMGPPVKSLRRRFSDSAFLPERREIMQICYATEDTEFDFCHSCVSGVVAPFMDQITEIQWTTYTLFLDL